jgi:hypothetical protein
MPFSVGTKLIKKQLELVHRARWAGCTRCRQSKMLMRYPLLSSRANEHLAMSRLRLTAAVGLLTGHTSLRAHLYKIGHTERQEYRLCGYDRGHCKHCMSLSCPSL